MFFRQRLALIFCNRSRDILVLVILLIVFTFRSHGSTKGVMSEL